MTFIKKYSSEVKAGDTVKVGGWVHDKRDLGNLIFLLLRDKDGIIQITAKTGETDEELIKTIKKLVKETVILVDGVAVENNRAPKGFELKPTKLEIVSETETPLPLEITNKVQSDIDTRLDNRFIDLRRAEVQAIFKIQSRIMKVFRDTLYNKEFTEIVPPSIIASTSEGGAELFPIPYYDKEAFLAQSPQLYKQMAVVGGLEKVCMITPVWRAEVSHTTKHLSESRQMDIEMAFADDNDVLEILDEVILNIFSDIKENCKEELKTLGHDFELPKKKMKRITYDETVELLNKNCEKMTWGDDISSAGEKKICEIVGWEQPFIITGWPTAVRAFYTMPDTKNPKISKSFDLIYKGVELLSGAQRIHKPEVLIDALNKKGLNPENFKDYIKTFRYGAPYHAGWSIGLERLTMMLTGVSNVREACLFPRDTKRITP
ncbi:MAG: aspartate--tRNA(Asn) ligase [DPANN group archaeon]|nr:aspartate--tRNA(Asn) ligase [DPANN group archaeon]